MLFLAGKVVFNTVNGGVPIHLDLVPFRVLGDATKQCIFGEEYYKKSDAQHKVRILKQKKRKQRKKHCKYDIMAWFFSGIHCLYYQ